MLSLRSFHVLLIAVAIVVTSGFGVWGLLNQHQLAGAISLLVSIVLVIYGGYFAAKAERVHLD